MSATLADKKVKRAIFTLMVIVAVDVLGLLLILPIVDTFAQSLGASKALIGTQFTVYSASSIFATIIVGRLSDYYGRKKIFLFSAIGAFISASACIFVQTFDQFLVASAVSGLFTGTVGTAFAYVGDIVPDETRRRKYISYITATLALCLVLGPLVGGSIATIYLRAPFMISAGIALIEVFLVIFFLQNPDELQALKEQWEYNQLLTAEDRALLRPPRQNNHSTSTSNSEDIETSISPFQPNVSLEHALSMKGVSPLDDMDSSPAYHPHMFSATEILRQVATNPNPNIDATTHSSIRPASSSISHYLDQSGSLVTVVVEDEDEALLSSSESRSMQPTKKKTSYIKASKRALSSFLSPSKSTSTSPYTLEDSTRPDSPQPTSSGYSYHSHNKSQAESSDHLTSVSVSDTTPSSSRINQRLLPSNGSENPSHLLNDEANNQNNNDASISNDTESRSPWLDYRAIIIGGVANFLNSCTYLGLVSLVPLILQEPRFGVVSGNTQSTSSVVFTSILSLFSMKDVSTSDGNSDDELSGSDIRRISLLMGLYLGCYGAIQVFGMIFVFPYVSHPSRCGLLGTAVLGSLLFGGSFACLPLLLHWYPDLVVNGLYGIVIVMGIGNALCRPVFPSFLNQIAPAMRRAEYMTLSATFANLALMIGGQMTALYAWQGTTVTVLLCGGTSLVNVCLIGIYQYMNSSDTPQK